MSGAEHFILTAGAVAAALIALAGVIGGVLKLRPLVKDVLAMLAQIRDASGGVQLLAGELRELGGSFVSFAIAYADRADENGRRLDEAGRRLDDLAELYTDMTAAIARLDRTVKGLLGRRAEDRPEDPPGRHAGPEKPEG